MGLFMMRSFFLALVAVMSSAIAAQAHEFWISPKSYQVAPGEPIEAHIRNGQNFKGGALSYLPRDTERFDIVMGRDSYPVTTRIGDRPAVNQTVPKEGLAVIVHETKDNLVSYSEWEKFVNFVTHKDAAWTLDEHQRRGLPEKGFRESYRRYAKSLVAVGNGEGKDAPMGLRTEIVAIWNPYTKTKAILEKGMPVRVLFEFEPKGDAQIEVFDRAPDGTVTTETYRTDFDGVAVFPVQAGHEYQVDSVALIPTSNDDATAGPVWHSLWANLTFAIPG